MRRVLFSLSALLIAGCDRDPVRPQAAPVMEPQTVAFLMMSDTLAAPGDEVAVIARARALQPIGSFTARLRFDASRLDFVGADPAGGMRAVNEREPGVLVVAGADPSGFTDDQLFVVRFRVLGGVPATGLRLEIAELVGTDFASLLPSLTVRGTVGAERGSR